MTNESGFKTQSFKSPVTPDRQWLDWFREEYSRQLYSLDIEPDPNVPFKIDATTRILPDLAIARSIRSPMRTLHRRGGNDDISMQILLAGRLSVQVGGKTYELAPGMGGIGRHGTPALVDIPDGVQLLSIRLRRHLLEPLMQEFGAFSALRDTQAMRLLLAYVRMIEAEDAISSSQMRHLVTTHVHDLVALAFGATREAEGMIEQRGKRAARLAGIKADVVANLADPNLSAIVVAARHGLTPRYVHMLFETEGASFSEFVVGQRLTRAYRMLGDPRFAGQSISAIALNVGFGDLSYFNRTFRRQFGATPSDVRAMMRVR